MKNIIHLSFSYPQVFLIYSLESIFLMKKSEMVGYLISMSSEKKLFFFGFWLHNIYKTLTVVTMA